MLLCDPPFSALTLLAALQVRRYFKQEVYKTFSMLDSDSSGEVELDEFVQGLQRIANSTQVPTLVISPTRPLSDT